MAPLLAVLLDGLAAGVRADGTSEGRRAGVRGHGRFSDGPRRVPVPRGASLRRARALGLGDRRAAGRRLSSAPRDRWVGAARGRPAESLHWPVDDGRFGRGFGFTRERRPDLRHDGVDLVAPEGSVVRAVGDGIVAYSDNGIRGYGNCVLIVHPGGRVSLYAHNYRNTVQAGWRVTRGERIGFVGATGLARGPHLHFELRRDGRLVDPLPFFETMPTERGRRHAVAARRRAGLDDGPPAPTPEARRGTDPATSDAAPVEEVAGVRLGARALTRRLLRRPAPGPLLEATGGRIFSNLLWPVRGGSLERSFHAGAHRGVDIAAAEGSAVRAAADGLVVHAGEGLPGLGDAVVLLHRTGWVTVYGSNREVAVEVGASGAADGAHLHFELHDGGRLRDPEPLLVQVPGG